MLRIYIIYTTVVKLFSKFIIFLFFIFCFNINKHSNIFMYICISRPFSASSTQYIDRQRYSASFSPFFFFFASNGYWGFSRNNATYTLRDISCAHVILTHGPLLRRLYRTTSTVDLLNEIGFPFERVFYPQNSREGWLMKWMAFR